jgi:hypothetical protein
LLALQIAKLSFSKKLSKKIILVKNLQSTIMKSSIQKNRFRLNLGTRFLISNGLGLEDFWSRTDNFKIPKVFSSLNELYFQKQSAMIFVFIDFQVTFSLASI